MDIHYIWGRLFLKLHGRAIKDSAIDKTSKVEAGSKIVSTTMGKYSYCGYNCEFVNCMIGNFCAISDRVIIGGASHPMEWASISPIFYKGRDSVRMKFAEHTCHENKPTKQTIVGSDVWRGSDVIIKAGVRVGDGAIIGMGSVETRDVPDYAIVGGNPAKAIRMRFEDDIALALQKIRWWEMPNDEIKRLAQFVPDINKFITEDSSK